MSGPFAPLGRARAALRTRLMLSVVCLLLLSCWSSAAQPRAAGTRTTPAPRTIEPIFSGGLAGGWQDYGWAERGPKKGGPERLDLASYGGWILANPHLTGQYGGLVLRFRAPADWSDFLQVRLDSETADIFPRISLGPTHLRALEKGWTEVFIPMAELNPIYAPFDRVVLRARRLLPKGVYVEVDEVGLTEADPAEVAGAGASAAAPGRPADFEVDCANATHQISPLIYGIAFSPLREYESEEQWKLGATARRWGGNPASRYNWELGNAWNAGSDYFFRNLNYTGRADFTWDTFLAGDLQRRVQSALTVPMLGWVARDTTSYSFPVDEFGAQQHRDPDVANAGDGVSAKGKLLEASAPLRTSVAAPPEFIERWVKTIRERDVKRGRSVGMYILDNEPMLWHDTHRDVHPEPATYDELLEKTIAYGAAVRRGDPNAVIAGPAEWGWPGYLYSALDAKAGFSARPDRRAHGDVALVPWYLKALAEHERKTGVRVLDVLDLHFYPQGRNIGVGRDGETDAETSARRIRSTRALWDPTYRDESWIGEAVQLIPRMRQWVAENDPGLKLSIGEYSFGAERHRSGGLALAEALGRFGQQDLYSAFYWTYPAEGTPAFWAFRAYRDYDGQGAHFLDRSLPTSSPRDGSIFAARNEAGTRLTMVALNLSPSDTLDASVMLKGCPAVASQRVFAWAGDPRGFTERKAPAGKTYRLAPWSITVVEVTLLPLRKP